jgi:DNA topoisomerase-1
MHVVVVESPAKAKTINKYLGPGYQVLASFGHVRDLPSKDGSVKPDEGFAFDWHVDGRGEQRLKEIAKAVKAGDELILATDPDREGEAISWHIVEELKRRKVLDRKPIKRVVFNEVTKNAVLEAMRNPRTLDQELVDAYLARRALDYLVGFTLSPVLWRKLPGSKSAGRVQSVALRLVCEREAEIEAFRPREYWSVEAKLANAEGTAFTARLTHLDGRKLDKFDLADEAAASAAVRKLESGDPFTVATVERKQARRNPFAPFTTSTLQQEASRKLGFGASHTMRVAQRLYEGIDVNGETVGLITYMRTDGVQLSQEAIDGSRRLISEQYGDKYLPDSPRIYKTAAKNAQEAHEAIRPTDLFRRPKDLARALSAEELRLYELIWKRTVASQMESAVLDQVAVDIDAKNGAARLRATGSVMLFDGFLTLYQEDRDDPSDDEEAEARLPKLAEGEAVRRQEVMPSQHFTQPPPRFSEASLVKRLEELGIGRPSTYASILQVLQDRGYVRLEKKRFIPEDTGRLVIAFLTIFFEHYFAYDFTANLEERLDDITGGRAEWKQVLTDFWRAFSTLRDDNANGSALSSVSDAVATLDKLIGKRSEVITAIDNALGPHFFPDRGDGKDPRACPACAEGRLGIKFGRNGGFIGCSTYPECRYTRPLAVPGEGEDLAALGDTGPRELGTDPATGLAVTLRKGPYGPYVQLGEASTDKKAEKPKRASLPRGMTPADIGLDSALALLALPREVGPDPESGEPIIAGIGRFGPYVKRANVYKSLAADDDVLTIGLNRAVALLAEPSRGRGRNADPGTPVGDHPQGGPITLHKGRYGPYIRHGQLIASLPRSMDPSELTLDGAVAMLAAQAEKAKAKGGAKGAGRRGASKKAAPKSSGDADGETKPAAKKKAPAKAKATAKGKPPTRAAAATKRASPRKKAAAE